MEVNVFFFKAFKARRVSIRFSVVTKTKFLVKTQMKKKNENKKREGTKQLQADSNFF